MKKGAGVFQQIFCGLSGIGLLISIGSAACAQDKKPYVRMVTMVIDSSQIENFRAALKEHAQDAINEDPGVLTFYAVYDKNKPVNVTLFEMYKSVAAYKAHSQTNNHLHYVATTAKMVNSLSFTEMTPIALERKRP